MYEISPRTYKIARQYGIEIEPSSRRFKDFHIYLKEQGEAYANERARLYYLRHKNASLREQLAKLLLWT